MKACVIKFLKKVWTILLRLFCFMQSKHEQSQREDEQEQSDE